MFEKKPKKEAEQVTESPSTQEPGGPNKADMIIGLIAMKQAKADCETKMLEALKEFVLATRMNVIGLDFYLTPVKPIGRSDQPKLSEAIYSIAVVACLP